MTTTNVLVCIHIYIILFIIILKDTTPTSWSITGYHSEQHRIDLLGRSKQTTPGKYPQSLTEPEGVKGAGFSFNLSPAYYMFLFMHLCLSAFLCPDAWSHISLSPLSPSLFPLLIHSPLRFNTVVSNYRWQPLFLWAECVGVCPRVCVNKCVLLVCWFESVCACILDKDRLL